jgi:hypothetical protein
MPRAKGNAIWAALHRGLTATSSYLGPQPTMAAGTFGRVTVENNPPTGTVMSTRWQPPGWWGSSDQISTWLRLRLSKANNNTTTVGGYKVLNG